MPVSGGRPLSSDGAQAPSSPLDACNTHNINVNGAEELKSTLKTKKSWFGSLRDVVQKGALQAKAAVDLLRTDRHKAELYNYPDINDNEEEQLKHHQSTEYGDASPTPLRAQHHRIHSLTSRQGVSSLRQHILRPTLRAKRSSVYSFASRPSSEMSETVEMETFAWPHSENTVGAAHGRTNSVASSLVGSIRRLGGRKTITSKCTSPGVESVKQAEFIPLPSSPIDIPSAPPALELNLGPSGFMSPPLGNSPEKQRTQEMLKLQDPANITTSVPKTPSCRPSHWIGTDKIRSEDAMSYVRDRCKFNDAPPSPSPEPSTLMLGTCFSLEIDGVSSDKLQVFERSVTPSKGRESRQLQTVRSLDAMAEAYATSDTIDEMRGRPEDGKADSDRQSLGDHSSSAPRPPPSHRDFLSASTVASCPSDMPELKRQKSMENSPIPSLGLDIGEDRNSKDPFADSEKIYSGPPSPVRSVMLPFRPKASDQSFGIGKLSDSEVDDQGELGHKQGLVNPFMDGLSLPHQIEKGKTNFYCSENNLEDVQLAAVQITRRKSLSARLRLQNYHDDVSSSHIMPGQSLEDQPQLQRDATILDEPILDQHLAQDFLTSEQSICDEQVAFDDRVYTRAQELLGCDFLSSDDNNNTDLSVLDGLSPHAGPLVPQLYRGINSNQTPSPGSAKSRTTYTTGLGDAEYKFTFDNWLKRSSDPTTPGKEHGTPNRRRMTMSLDSDSSVEYQETSVTSSGSTNPDCPPPMGDRLDFDLKRSERNMRYNSLWKQEEVLDISPTAACPSRRPLRFVLGSSDGPSETELNPDDLVNTLRALQTVSATEVSNVEKEASDSGETCTVDPLKDTLSGNREAEVNSTESIPVAFKLPPDSIVSMFGPISESSGHKSPAAEYQGSCAPSPKALHGPKVTAGLHPDSAAPGGGAKLSVRPSPLYWMNKRQSTHRDTSEVSDMSLASASSFDPKSIRNNMPRRDRVASADTLDQSLHLFSNNSRGPRNDEQLSRDLQNRPC